MTGEGLVVAGPSALHRLAPHAKVVGAVAIAVAIVSTPREALWAFAAHGALLAALAAAGRVPVGVVLRRTTIAVPFVAFAALLPFIAHGERVEVLGIGHVSAAGTWAAWNILAKAVLGLAVTVLLVSTTPLGDVLRGLDRLRVPPVFTAVAGFMLRYVHVVLDELARMQVARASRCDDPRWLWQARAVAATAGALFVRSYERGERVHLAMLSRGFDGTLRRHPAPSAPPAQWLAVLSVVAVAAAVALVATWR